MRSSDSQQEKDETQSQRHGRALGSKVGEGTTCFPLRERLGAWWAAVPGVTESRMWLGDFSFTFMHWRRKWQPTPVFLPGESQGQRSLVGCRLWGHTESDMTEAT